MKFFKAIASGTTRTARSSKQIVVIWILSALLVSLLIIPFKRSLLSYSGSSLFSEILQPGFDISYFLEFTPDIANLFTSLTFGLFLFIGLSLLLNIFLSGGLFDSLRVNNCTFKVKDFFSSSARLFFPFLWVNILVILLILTSLFIFVGVPVLIMKNTGASGASIQGFGNIAKFIIFFIALIYLLVADYARAWLAASEKRSVFKAVGYGFKALFTSFFTSYIFMILAVAIQLGFTWISIKIMGSFNPEQGGGLFLMFVVANLLVILRLYLRAFRYGGVSALYSLG